MYCMDSVVITLLFKSITFENTRQYHWDFFVKTI